MPKEGQKTIGLTATQGFFNDHTGGKGQTAADEHKSPWEHRGTVDLPPSQEPSFAGVLSFQMPSPLSPSFSLSP